MFAGKRILINGLIAALSLGAPLAFAKTKAKAKTSKPIVSNKPAAAAKDAKPTTLDQIGPQYVMEGRTPILMRNNSLGFGL